MSILLAPLPHGHSPGQSLECIQNHSQQEAGRQTEAPVLNSDSEKHTRVIKVLNSTKEHNLHTCYMLSLAVLFKKKKSVPGFLDVFSF